MRRIVTKDGLAKASINIARILLAFVTLISFCLLFTPISNYFYIFWAALAILLIYVTIRKHKDLLMWITYILAFVVFAYLRALADETGIQVHFDYPIDLEKILFFGTVPTVWLQQRFYIFGEVSFLDIFVVSIQLSYFFTPHIAAFIAWRQNSGVFRLYVISILGTLYAGLTVSFAVPTAPPWLAGQTGNLTHIFRLLRDIMNPVEPEVYTGCYELVGINEVAAMPSVHMAVTCVIAFLMWRLNPVAGVLSTLYAGSMGFALVYGGEHYVVDLLAGIVVAVAVWILATKASRT